MSTAPAGTEAMDGRPAELETWGEGCHSAARIVSAIAGVEIGAAREAPKTSDGEVKLAVLIAAGAEGPAEAEKLLGQTKGNLRALPLRATTLVLN